LARALGEGGGRKEDAHTSRRMLDDLGADCDDWYAMYFEITANGAGSSDVVSIEP
jgi:hypothetical protein